MVFLFIVTSLILSLRDRRKIVKTFSISESQIKKPPTRLSGQDDPWTWITTSRPVIVGIRADILIWQSVCKSSLHRVFPSTMKPVGGADAVKAQRTLAAANANLPGSMFDTRATVFDRLNY